MPGTPEFEAAHAQIIAPYMSGYVRTAPTEIRADGRYVVVANARSMDRYCKAYVGEWTYEDKLTALGNRNIPLSNIVIPSRTGSGTPSCVKGRLYNTWETVQRTVDLGGGLINGGDHSSPQNATYEEQYADSCGILRNEFAPRGLADEASATYAGGSGAFSTELALTASQCSGGSRKYGKAHNTFASLSKSPHRVWFHSWNGGCTMDGYCPPGLPRHRTVS